MNNTQIQSIMKLQRAILIVITDIVIQMIIQVQIRGVIAIMNIVIQKKNMSVIALNQNIALAQINLLVVMIIIVVHLMKIKDIEKTKNII